MHIHFVSFAMNDISKALYDVKQHTAAQLNELQHREKLHKEVKRRDREASDFQVKVSEM